MKSLLFSAACGLSLVGAAACAPHTPAARAALDCPATQGKLTRTGMGADGKTCAYVSSTGDEVSLRLIPVSNGVQAALAPIEQELQAEVGPPTTADTASDDQPASPKSPKPPRVAGAGTAAGPERTAREIAADAAKADAEADADADGGATASGAHRHHGESTHIDLPGVHVDADGDRETAEVQVGMIHVNAGENGAVIRMSRDVRLRGEAFSPEKRGFRASYILARDNLKDGYRAVGYEAAGPRTGPITVAVVKSRTGEHHHLFNSVKKLVRRNGGV
ncbi:hypothetical protein DJ021_16855 [Phenylobacterium hankyongense]|uniref:Uncharacterized protein n=1 Tax=Phenylobacterium hankyongense TaxID=1813876 RepID=A0A328B1M5_9CAUL|nr:hypothetical protein [Phenylobacterium hankyongense]RAK61352.1 hypothetical protein DJ021_16855 [Phenylobacterium hankyongense]